jgi:flagellar basal body-associated protein FliL
MKKKILIIIPVILALGAALYFFVIAAPPKPAEKSFYATGDSFVTNIKDSARLAKITVVLGILSNETEKADEFLKEHNQMIRDTIVFTLRSKTEAELRADNVKDDLCDELIKNLNTALEIDYISGVYFTDYVIQ